MTDRAEKIEGVRDMLSCNMETIDEITKGLNQKFNKDSFAVNEVVKNLSEAYAKLDSELFNTERLCDVCGGEGTLDATTSTSLEPESRICKHCGGTGVTF